MQLEGAGQSRGPCHMYQGFPIVLRGWEEPKAGTACSKAELRDAASESAMWMPASLPSPGAVTEKRDPRVNPCAPQKKILST